MSKIPFPVSAMHTTRPVPAISQRESKAIRRLPKHGIQAFDTGKPEWRLGLTATKIEMRYSGTGRGGDCALARHYLAPVARPGVDYVLIARHDTAFCMG